MDNDTDYHFQYLNRYSDFALSSTILIIIGAIIGVIGNSTITFFYFFRIKERGERYFIPLLGIVDLLGCLTSPPYYIMDNEYMFNYPNTTACRMLSFLQVCIPGISAHTLLLISIQRYLLVCKPFGPKMTNFWKRVFFGVVCMVSLAYSAPLLATAGAFEDNVTYMNHNITTEVCKFSGKRSLSMRIYTTFLFLLMVTNLITTAGLYIPVLRQVKISFRSRTGTYEIHRDSNVTLQTETSQATHTSDIENYDAQNPSNCVELREVERKVEATILPKKVRFETRDISNEQPETSNNHNNVEERSASNNADHPQPAKSIKSTKSKAGSAQRRVSMMFFYLIVAYMLSFTPPLIILVLLYTRENFTFHTMTRNEMAVWFFLTRLVFMNHIVNPFIYGFFDTKFKKQLCKCFKRKN